MTTRRRSHSRDTYNTCDNLFNLQRRSETERNAHSHNTASSSIPSVPCVVHLVACVLNLVPWVTWRSMRSLHLCGDETRNDETAVSLRQNSRTITPSSILETPMYDTFLTSRSFPLSCHDDDARCRRFRQHSRLRNPRRCIPKFLRCVG